jgi:hypothetical protein
MKLRAELAPFAIDLLLACAGFGVLLAAGVVSRRAVDMLGALGLAYLTGTAVVPLVLVTLLVVGVPLELETFAAVVLICVVIGVLRSRGREVDRKPSRAPRRGWLWRSWTVDARVTAVFVVVFGAFSAIGLLSAFDMPLIGGDAWTIWARKAEMLTVHGSLRADFFASPSYGFMHPDYPLQYPVWEALHFRASGTFDTSALLRHVWLLLVAFVWAVAYLLRKQVRPVVWAPLLLLAAAAPGIWQQLLNGYADVPMAIFACLGAICLALWLRDGEGRFIGLAALMLAAAANTKNEGLMAAVSLLIAAGGVTFFRRLRIRQFLLAGSLTVLAILPWRIWLATEGIKGDMPVSEGVNPGYLLDRTDRVWPAIHAIGHQLADQGRWLYLLPLAVLVLVASLLSGIGRRVAGFYLVSLVLFWAGLVWSYWISPYPIGWHLSTSAGRVISVLMFICLAAVVHLSGVLMASLEDRPRQVKGEPASESVAPLEPVATSD